MSLHDYGFTTTINYLVVLFSTNNEKVVLRHSKNYLKNMHSTTCYAEWRYSVYFNVSWNAFHCQGQVSQRIARKKKIQKSRTT